MRIDLIVLVPDADTESLLREPLAERQESLGIQLPRFEVVKHPRRDPACFKEAEGMLRPYQKIASYALVVFDHEGSGQEKKSPVEVAEDLRSRLGISGWADRAEVIVLRPELEVWVWSDSPQLARILAWEDRSAPLREWLRREGWWPSASAKPPRPKETLQHVLRQTQLRRSASIYGELAARVGLERCADPAFLRLRETLQCWFPLPG